MSERAAVLMRAQLEKRSGIETELIDVAKLPSPVDDA